MIPILYEGSETEFTTNGLGRIPCTSCVVREERNGIYECTFAVPVTESIYPEIKEGRIIYCIHDDAKDGQPFDIYGRSAPMNGLVIFYAHHISYRLSKITVKPYSAASCAEALSKIQENSLNHNPFTFWTDKTVSTAFNRTVPTAVRSLLVGQEGSILDVYGKGEYKFDKFSVKLYVNRGVDNGVSIRYGKNLTDIEQELDDGQTYNAVAPFWKSQDDSGVVTLPEGMIVNEGAAGEEALLITESEDFISDHDGNRIAVNDAYIKCIPLDLSSYFEEEPTVDQLRNRAYTIFTQSGGWTIKENITIDFVALWQTPEYAGISALERVSLCDRISVIHPILGISANKVQVISVEYDVLAERYSKMELGAAKSTYSDTIKAEIEKRIYTNVPTSNAMTTSIDHATQMIAGAMGGNIVINRDANGKPIELLVMDTDDANTAVNVWRWSLGGLGHSHNGYAGPFSDVALTADGQINADMITTGTLKAIRIVNGDDTFKVEPDGTVTANAINITGGSINITTNTDNYDVVQLAYLWEDGTTVTSGLSPMELRLSHIYDEETSEQLVAQAGALILKKNGETASAYGNTAMWYLDENGTTRFYQYAGGQSYYSSSGDLKFALTPDYMRIYDDSGTLRKAYTMDYVYTYNPDASLRRMDGVNSYFYNSAGALRRTDMQDRIELYDDAETLRYKGMFGSSTYYDENGTIRLYEDSVQHIRYDESGVARRTDTGTYTTFKNTSRTTLRYDDPTVTRLFNSSGALKSEYAPGYVRLYDDDGILGRQDSFVSTIYYDASSVKRRQEEANASTMYDSSGTTRRETGLTTETLYNASGKKRRTDDLSQTVFYDDSAVERRNDTMTAMIMYDSNHVKRRQDESQAITMFSEYSQERVSISVANGISYKNAYGQELAGISSYGINICNASGYGVIIDGTGFSTGTWVWKTFRATDNTLCQIPCKINVT